MVPVGGAEPHEMLVFETEAKLATGAGSTVMVLDAVMTRLQLSVKVQLSV
jgi:hypothetical protein